MAHLVLRVPQQLPAQPRILHQLGGVRQIACAVGLSLGERPKLRTRRAPKESTPESMDEPSEHAVGSNRTGGAGSAHFAVGATLKPASRNTAIPAALWQNARNSAASFAWLAPFTIAMGYRIAG